MANPNSPLNGQGLALPLMVDSDGDPMVPRMYVPETFGGDDPAGHAGIALVPAGSGAVDTDAAAAMTAELAAVASKKNYLAGFMVSGKGATAASAIECTVAGLAIGTMRVWVQIPAGTGTAIDPLFVTLPNPIPASAENTAITLSVPSFGAGNTDAECAIWGYVTA